MRRVPSLSAIGLIALSASCGDDTTGTGGEGGSGGSRPTATATSTSSSSASTSMTTSSSIATVTSSTATSATTTNTTGAGGEGGQGGEGGAPPGVEVDCADGDDDDDDGGTDCADVDCAASAACGNLVVNELDYDMSGADDFEFVEIFNAGAGPVSLDGVSVQIINGATGNVADAVPLAGMLPAGGYLVVADAGVGVDPQATVVLLPDNVENGPTDAVAIYDANSNVVVDAISYEGAVSSVDIDGTNFDLGALEGGSPTVSDSATLAALSLIRLPNGVDTNVADADWKGTTTLTPGAANIGTESCSNTVDDDLDGLIDCADPDCTAAPGCTEVCDDAMDNDADGQIDCSDADCSLQSCGPLGVVCIGNVCECPGGQTETSCNDGNDNDCDGQIDCADGDCAASCPAPAIYFSEYVEGTNNDKAIEIHNPGGTAFDLAAASCSIRIYADGAGAPGTTVALSGTIAADDVHVVCNNTANATLAPLCDQLAGGMMMGNLDYDGNDAVELVCNGTTLDVIGQIGFDPMPEWGSALTSTADNTLRRSCTSFPDRSGADVFDPAVQWTGFATDTFDGLGARSCPAAP